MKITFILLNLFMGIFSPGVNAADDYSRQRQQMVADIQDMVSDTRSYIGKAALDYRVMAAMRKVLRHELVPDAIKPHAYINSAAVITTSILPALRERYPTARLEVLAGPWSKVLEIG